MTAIRPSDSALRDKIEEDAYNQILNDINAQYSKMDILGLQRFLGLA